MELPVSPGPLWSFLLLSFGLAWACSPAPVAPPVAPAPPAAPSAVASDSATPPAAPSASEVSAPPPPAASSASAEAPPCIDGEMLMGACICSKGKGVDSTGHCVFMPCPKSTTGTVVFRSESTGQCMECKPGKVQCGDGCCSR